MRTICEIVDRAFLNLMFYDRAALDLGYVKYSKKEIASEREDMIQAFIAKKLEKVASRKEKAFIMSPINGIKDQRLLRDYYFYYFGIPVLLWTVGLHEFPHYDAVLYREKQLPIYLNKSEADLLKEQKNPPSEEEIKFMCEVAMLWHWRQVEGREHPHKAIPNLDESIIRIFGEDYRQYLQAIPHITLGGVTDFAVKGKPYYKIDHDTLGMLNLQTEEFHRALEWVLGDESWENTDTST